MSPIKQDGPYDSRTLTKWFAASSVLLVGSTVWMVLDDTNGPTRAWKRTQEEFRGIEVAQARAVVQEAQRKLDEKGVIKEGEAKIEEAKAKVAEHKGAIAESQKKYDEAEARLEAAKLRFSDTKSRLESAGYFFEEHKEKGDVAPAKSWGEKVEHLQEQLAEDGRRQEEEQLAVNAAKGEIAKLEEALTKAEKDLSDKEGDRDRAKRKLSAVDYSFINMIRNKPLVDFLDPTIKPKQIVLNNLKDDYYFAMVRKVDRCQTCHLAIDRKGFYGAILDIEGRGLVAVASATPRGADWDLVFEDGHKETVSNEKLAKIPGHDNPVRIEAPFTTHPRLDLFLGSSAPHPIEKFGCTVCHLGEGQSINFKTAAHTPNDDETRERWRKEHSWEVREHWGEPQWPTRYVEASCLLCHANNRPVPGADKLNFGREIWERVSCMGCHKMKGYDGEAKRGPDLRHIAAKLTPEFAAYWIENPPRFRPKTNMPRFFGIAPISDEEKGELRTKGTDVDAREQVEVRSIVEFLFAKSDDWKGQEPRGTGDAARGKSLFTQRGCVGCHRIEPTETEAKLLRTYAPDEFGPNLYNTGWKTTAKWVASWVKDPKHYWTDTRMPNLRLSDQDALDLGAYLTDGAGVKDAKRPEGMKETLGAISADQRSELERLVTEYLEKDFTKPERDAILSGKPLVEKHPSLGDEKSRLLYLGEMSVGRYGCFGCHNVKGMEQRPGIGRELSNIADKPLGQIDFGFESVARDAEVRPAGKIRTSVDEWLHLKVTEPRIFDRGKVKAWLDRARMPRFKLEPFEREALVTYLLGHTDARQVPDEYKYKPATRRANVVEGEYAIQRNNCKACHLFAVDKISATNGSGELITEELRDSHGDVVRSPLTSEPIKVASKIDGLVLLDNRGVLDKNGKPAFGDDARALIAVFGDSKTMDKHPGDWIVVGGDDFKNCSVESPKVGAEADLLKVIDAMPDVAFAKQPGATIDKKDAAELRAAQRAAVVSMIGARNRGGTSLEKIVRARFAAPKAQKGVGFDAWSADAAKDWSPDNVTDYIAALEEGKTYGPPHLLGEGRKVQPLWLQSFMKEPVEIRPWLDVRMPTFGFADPDAQKFSRYFAATDEDRRIAIALPLLEVMKDKIKAKEGEPGYEPGWKTRAEIQEKVYAALDPLGVREYFALTIQDGVLNFAPRGDVSLSRAVEEKTDRYQEEKEKTAPGWYGAAYRLFVDADVNCQKCHMVNGQDPLGAGSAGDRSSWAPDLSRIRERLRPEYMRDWIENPKRIVPGTKMPQLLFDKKKQNLLAGPATKQIDAIVDWLAAGALSTLEAFPTSVKRGESVRLTSQMLNLDGVRSLKVAIDGKEIEVKDLAREKSAERTAAIRFVVPAEAGGKRVVVSANDGRFIGAAEVQVE